jgi:hypothetical protein
MPCANDADTAVASLFCNNVRHLDERLGKDLTVGLVHHSTKYEDVFRGAGAFDADTDAMLLAKKVGAKKAEEQKSTEEKAAEVMRLMASKADEIKRPPLAFDLSWWPARI